MNKGNTARPFTLTMTTERGDNGHFTILHLSAIKKSPCTYFSYSQSRIECCHFGSLFLCLYHSSRLGRPFLYLNDLTLNNCVQITFRFQSNAWFLHLIIFNPHNPQSCQLHLQHPGQLPHQAPEVRDEVHKVCSDLNT